MSIVHTYDGSDLTAPATVQLKDETAGFSASAQGGEADIIHVIVDDSAGVLTFTGHKTWRVRETECAAGNQVIWAGFVGRQTVNRGKGAVKFPTATGRRWELDLIEVNTYIGRRVLGWTSPGVPDTTANRPAETVSARITWLLTTLGFTGGLIADHGLIEASSVMLDAFDFANQKGSDVLAGCAVASGYIPHIRYREASDDYELIFLDFLVSGRDLSTVVISNAGDDDHVTIWAPNDCDAEYNPERIAGRIILPFNGGAVCREDAATIAAFGAIDQVAPSSDVDNAATATIQADHYLAQHDSQEESITGLTIRLPAANVNDVKQGQRVMAKLTHAPNWTTSRPARVTRRNVRVPENLTQAAFDVDLDLAAAIIPTASHARVMRPNDNLLVSRTGYLAWSYDGDAPAGGDNLCLPGGDDPAYGLLAYYPVGSKPAGGWEGIVAQGGGLLSTIDVAADVSGVSGGGTVNCEIQIRVNGVMVATATFTDTGAGAHGVVLNLAVSATDIPVSNGDVITAWIESTGNWAGAFVVPAGTGNCSHHLLATGSLAAR